MEQEHPGKIHFKNLSTAPLKDHPSEWSALWKTGFTPWDRNKPSVALQDLLLQRQDLVPSPPTATDAPRPRALVPGCGRGHDVLLLAEMGYDVFGLDLAVRAVEEAVANEGEGKRKGSVGWVVGNFFEDEFLERTGGGEFDLIYDYTFLCALPPTQRPAWAHRMAQLLAPTGRLVCLEFPSGKPLSEPGPPWGLNSDVYLALLSRPGEEVEYDASGSGRLAGDGTAAIKRASSGLRRLDVFQPARTHDSGIGPDGEVMDRVSVWSH